MFLETQRLRTPPASYSNGHYWVHQVHPLHDKHSVDNTTNSHDMKILVKSNILKYPVTIISEPEHTTVLEVTQNLEKDCVSNDSVSSDFVTSGIPVSFLSHRSSLEELCPTPFLIFLPVVALEVCIRHGKEVGWMNSFSFFYLDLVCVSWIKSNDVS